MPIENYSDALAGENQFKLQETWSPEQIEKRRRMEGKPSVYYIGPAQKKHTPRAYPRMTLSA